MKAWLPGFSLFFFASLFFNSQANARNPVADTTLPVSVVNFFVSSYGLNSNNGTSASTPKKNIDSITPLLMANSQIGAPLRLALETNSVFREEFNPVNNVRLESFSRGAAGKLPKITGMNVVTDWKQTTGSTSVFENLFRHGIDLDNPQYSYVMLAEIDTMVEKTNSIAAVKYLKLAANLAACQNEAGTYYTPDLKTNPVMIYIHPTSGIPGKSVFRYEAASRRFSINGYYYDGATYENLFLQTSGNGYGMLSGGDRTVARNITFQGGGTHHLVIKSGTIDSCLFLPGPKGLKERIASVFYEAEGSSNVNRLTNSVFLDIPTPVYTHTNGVVNHRSLTIDNVYAFGDPGDAVHGLSSADSDSISVTNSYTENYPTGWYGVANTVSINNTIFRNTNQSAIHILQPKGNTSEVTLNNILIKTNGNDANQSLSNGQVVYGVRASYPNINVNLSNSIVHGFSTWNQNTEPAIQTFQVRGKLAASKNIYICDINDNNYMHIVQADNTGGMGSSSNIRSDNNVYILLRGKGFHWFVYPNNNGESSVLSLATWQQFTGQDRNSIFIDLRQNPLGLKAIFQDPENGNWSFAETDVAAKVKATSAGMTNAPLYYPMRPLVNGNEAFRSPGGFSSFQGVDRSPNETSLGWRTFKENDIAYFTIENSTDSISFAPVDTVRGNTSGLDHNYLFVHQHSAVPRNYYRLKITRSDSSFFYSPVVGLKTPVREGLYLSAFPNPFQNTITIDHPSRPNAVIGVYNFGGRLIKTFNIADGIVRTRLPLSNMQKGIYILRWSAGHEAVATMILR